MGLFDTVTVYNEMMKKEMIVRIVTTLRQDALKGLISKGNPLWDRPSWAVGPGERVGGRRQSGDEIYSGDPKDRKGFG